MKLVSKTTVALPLLALIATPMAGSVMAQERDSQEGEVLTTVYGAAPADLSGMPKGPQIEGIITARKGDKLQVTGADGTSTVVTISDGTEIRGSGGFLGLSKGRLARDSLLNGLPVTVDTVQWGGTGLIASKVALKSRDLRTAQMIRSGTAQGFAEQTAATDALRSRVADIDEYNVKGTTNVYFDTAKYNLSTTAQADLCTIADQARATDNALLLVVGYTDSTGDYEFNQELSEKRASRVVNFLQQQCNWKPYRMLTPTGMAEADPAADNTSEAGKAQNRRVAVNILVSKSVDGL
ncbi:MAG: OmpA family protein [Erythrobacter sp.]|jgi:outer membrane protein OmpA-like peptidoglycan-associated protein